MSAPPEDDSERRTGRDPAIRLRLPGFIRDEEIGLGDVVKRVTYAFGIQPCTGCEARAASMNGWVRFTR